MARRRRLGLRWRFRLCRRALVQQQFQNGKQFFGIDSSGVEYAVDFHDVVPRETL
jgi:hypothetical protein